MGTRFTSGRSPRIHEPCIQRWCGDPGDGGGEDDVDVCRLQAYLSQRLAHCLGAQLGADADEGVVGPSKGEVWIVLHREGQVAPSDGHSLVESSQSVDVVMSLRPLLNKRRISRLGRSSGRVASRVQRRFSCFV